jgi:oligoribonuclease
MKLVNSFILAKSLAFSISSSKTGLLNRQLIKASNLVLTPGKYFSKNREFLDKMSIANSSHIVWVDLEMSGLDIDTDHILEMACLITDKDLNVVAEGPELIIHQSDEVLAGMDAWCIKHHGESGLTQSVRDSKISVAEAESLMLDFLNKNGIPKGQCPLGGNSIHADRLFLNKYMKNFLGHLHYRVVDVSSFKECIKRWYPDESGFAKKNAHRALGDIKESIAELKYYREKYLKKN